MSGLERPYLERRPGDAPSSCPVCGAATRPLVRDNLLGATTCRAAGPDHFEWWPTPAPAMRVESERVDDCPIDAGAGSCSRPAAECCVTAGYSGPTRTTAPADNRRYDKSSTTPHSSPEVEGWTAMLHLPGCPALNRSGDCTCPPVPVGTPYPRPDDVVEVETSTPYPPDSPSFAEYERIQSKINDIQRRMRFVAATGVDPGPGVTTSHRVGCPHTPRCRDRREPGDPEWTATELACGRLDDDEEQPAGSYCGCPGAAMNAHLHGCPTLPLEGTVVGVDWRAAAMARLRPGVARLAVLHEPTFQSPPKCKGCVSLRSQNPTVKWPCDTATVALDMMRLSASDIAITSRPS